MMPPASVRIGMTVDFIPTARPPMMLVACPVDDCWTIESTGFLPIAVKYSVTKLMIAPTTLPTTIAPNTPFREKLAPREGFVHVIVSGNIQITTKYEAITVRMIDDQLPRLSAFCTLDFSSLILTNAVPMMEKTIPKPQMTIGRRIGESPSNLSTALISCPSTIVAKIVATYEPK